MKTLRRVGVFLVLGYVMLCGMLYFFPEMFLYAPSTEVADVEYVRKNGYLADVVTYEAEDGTKLYGWYAKPYINENNKVVVFMHGNAYNLEGFFHKVVPFNRYGYATFMAEYRGFGGIKGKINDENLAMDAVAAIRELNKQGYKNEDIVLYGFSLGTYVATKVAHTLQSEGRFDALVLEVPFNNLPNVAKEIFPIYMPFDILIKDKYDTMAIIGEVDARVLIMASTGDRLVPSVLAEDLFKYAKEPKEIIIYEDVGHNFLYDLENFVDVKKWLEKR